jgi:glycosyltransferase involved in cell wall biosynthesis
VRLVHVVDDLPAAAAWCGGVARALARRGHDVRVLAVARAAGAAAWGSHDLDDGVRVRRLPPSPPLAALARLAGRPAARRSPALRGALGRAVLAHDAVHLHGATAPGARLAWLATRLARRPLVVTPHLGPEPPGAAARWLCARADAVVLVGPEEEALVRRAAVVARRFVVSGVGAPEPEPGTGGWRERLGVAAGDALVVFDGPTDWGTGAIPFVDAIRLLRLEGRAVTAVLLGEYRAGDGRPRRLWQAGRVPVIEPPPLSPGERHALLGAADAVVLPSGWRLGAAYDAWEAEVPVLAPDDGGAGVVTFPSRDPAALARRLAALLDDPTGTAGLVVAGRRRLGEAPSWAAVAARMESLYGELSRAGGRGSAA